MMKNKKGFALIEVLLFILIVALLGIGGWYVRNNSNDTSNETLTKTVGINSQTKTPNSENGELNNITSHTYTSKLYEGISYYLPPGWIITEPDMHESPSYTIAKKGGIELSFKFWTERNTGFETTRCEDKKELKKFKNFYRYIETEGYEYGKGYGVGDKYFQEYMEYADSMDTNSNYCEGGGTQILQKYKFLDAENNDSSLVWLMNISLVGGYISQNNLAEADAIVTSVLGE